MLKTESMLIIETLTALASAITWTTPNDSSSVRFYINEAFEAIDKLKELSISSDKDISTKTSSIAACPFCESTAAPEISDVGDCGRCVDSDFCEFRKDKESCEGCNEWPNPMIVVCNYNNGGCGACGPARKTRDEAAHAWNTWKQHYG